MLSSPKSALRMSAVKSTLPAPRATRRLRMRPPPCKHYAASVRRRSYRSSLRCFGRDDFLDQGFETRIAAQIVEQRISRKKEQIAIIASGKGMLERCYRSFFL